MDEPLSNLDAKLRAEMRDEIHRLQRNLNLTMVYVTHDQTEAMSMADQVVLLKDGKIVQIGTAAELYEQPSNDFAAQFLGTPPMNVLPINELEPQAAAVDGSWFLGIRPEKIRIDNSGLPVEVSAVDYMGAETVLRLRHRDNILILPQLVVREALDLPGHRLRRMLRLRVRRAEHHQRRPPPAVQRVLGHGFLPGAPLAQHPQDVEALPLVENFLPCRCAPSPAHRGRTSNGTAESGS